MASTNGLLILEYEGNVVRTLPLTFEQLTIGRAPDNDLSLQHPAISRRHLEVRLALDGLVLTDLGSVNGTFVDGTRLLPHRPTHVERGQELRVGPFILVAQASPDRLDELVLSQSINGNPPVRTPRTAGPDPVEFERALARRAAGQRPSVERTLPSKPYTGPPSTYLQYLPSIFAENDFFGRFLLMFESIWEPLENRQDHMDMYVDPATCPESFLPWLASWFDVDVSAHWPEDRLRELVGNAMDLYQWRGTRYGMARMIELWTGLTPQIDAPADEPFVFHVRLAIPDGHQIDRNAVEELVRTHKPAHAGYLLEFA